MRARQVSLRGVAVMRRVADGDLRRTRRSTPLPSRSYDGYYARLGRNDEFVPPERPVERDSWRRFVRLLNQRGEPLRDE
jgi:hypothetical protein